MAKFSFFIAIIFSISASLAGPNSEIEKLIKSMECIGCNFSNLNLKGSNFWNFNISNSNFTKSNLVKSNFQGSNLSGSIFNNSILISSQFHSVNLDNSSLLNIKATAATFIGASFRNTTYDDFRV